MITPQQEQALTQSRYFHLEQGEERTIVCTNWRFEEKSFKNDTTKAKNPTLVLDVISIDGQRTYPREFNSTNKPLNTLLLSAIHLSEKNDSNTIKVRIKRLDKTNYDLANMFVVDNTVYGGSYGESRK